MSDTDGIAEPVRERHRRARPSFVWLAPLIALALSLGIAWKSWSNRGPLVEVILDSASGIEAGKTVLKHKDVEIGTVEDVGFTEGLEEVLLSIRVDKDLEPWLDDSAQFWVVRPQVSVRGVTGLDTVLSGPYVEVAWDREKGKPRRRFKALKDIPLSKPGDSGTRLRLRANDGGAMSVGAPILYRRIEVGRVESKQLSPEGERVDFSIFIEKPYDRLISTATRFWNVSGVAVEIGTEGAKLKVDSLASLLQGGISFDTVAADGAPVPAQQSFVLYETEAQARRSVFTDDPGSQLRLSVEFEGSVRGLKIGAPVEYRGLRVGEVTDVSANVRRSEERGNDISLIVTIVIAPSRLGLEASEMDNSLEFLSRAIRRGLRARLKSASLLTGALFVELVEQPDAPVALLDDLARPYPRIPSVPSDFEDFTASAEGVLNRINNLPIEELMFSATELLRNLNALASADSTAAVPGNLNGLLADARALLSDPALKAAPGDLAATLAASRALMEEVREAGAAEALVQALNDASAAAKAVTAVSAGLPALVTSATALSDDLNEVPITDLVVAATTLLEDADKIVTAEGITEIPGNLNASVVALRRILEELREAESAKTLQEVLVASREAANRVTAASVNIPGMVQTMTGIANTVNELPFEDLVTAATKLVANADKLVASEGMQAAPQALADTLEAARALLVELEEADAAANLSAALVAARDAATAFKTAAESTPQLIARLDRIAANVEGLPLDELLASVQGLINDADALVGSEGMQAAPQALADTLNAARALMVDLQQADTAKNLSDALKAARSAATSIAEAAAGTPALIARLEGIAENVEELPLDQLMASVQRLIADANALVGSQGMQEAPQALADTLNAARSLMVDLQRADTAQKLSDALIAAQGAAQGVSNATQGIPLLSMRLSELAEKANALPIEGLLASATLLVQDADRILTAPGAEQIPGSLTAALDQVRSLVVELRQSGTATNVNGALVSVAEAGQSFQALSRNLAILIPKLAAVAETADSVLSSVDVGSELNYEAAAALREVRDAARAITALAATVERRPNSLILGK